jgi:hypothetical protein
MDGMARLPESSIPARFSAGRALRITTQGLAAGWPNVQGRCPACHRGGLFLGEGGYVTCSQFDCPDPGAPSSALGVE